ncbi:MAG: EAL domain-containing protein [Magnetococcales bacterium]|nr:EAL domain-containing protein [Magnetococcales bacterium]
MRFLESLSFHVKLLLILLIPLGGILGLGLVGIHEKRVLIVEMERMNHLSGLAVQISDLIHEIQRERGFTAGFLGSRGKRFQEELACQRARVESSLARLNQSRQELHQSERNADALGEPFQSAIADLDKRDPIRQTVDQLEIDASEAIGYFSAINLDLLNTIDRLSSFAATVEIATLTRNYTLFLQGKERAGIERAIIAETLTAGRFAPGMYRRFSALVSEQETLFGIFRTLVSPGERVRFDAIAFGADASMVERMREVLFKSGHASALYIQLGLLYQNMALRGAYHSVKNLLIRGSLYGDRDENFDPAAQQRHYQLQFEGNHQALREIVARIRALSAEELSPDQRGDVELVWENIEAYRRSITRIIEMQRQGATLHEIDLDPGVKIDDRPADEAIRRLVESTRVGRFSMEVNDWFAASTARIDQFKELEDQLSLRLITRGKALEKESRNELLAYRLAMLAIMLLALGMGSYLVRRLRDKTERIVRLSRQIRAGDLSARIELWDATHQDELDRIAMAMNRMVEGLDRSTRLTQETMHALANSENRLRSMLETAPDAILSLDAAGRVESVNPAGEDLFGYYPGTMAGCFIEDLVPNFREVLTLHDVDGISAHRTVEVEGLCRDEGKFPVEVSMSGYESVTGAWHYLLIMNDITERRQVKMALASAYAELEQRVRERTFDLEQANRQLFAEIDERTRAEQGLTLAAKVFETATEGILITDAKGRIIKCNHAFMEISGYSFEEVYGRLPSMMSSGRHDQAFYEAMWKGILEDGAWSGEIWNRRKCGEIFPQKLSITTVWNGDNELTHYVGIFSDITELKETEKRLEQMAYFDALTHLPNRVLFRDRLQHELDKKTRYDFTLAVFFIDLDRFKHVNDSLGHSAGDQLLVEVAERIRISLRKYDTVARLGGDEFAAIITGLKDGREAAPVARKIIESLKTAFYINGHEVFVGASIGISVFPNDGEEIETLTKHADIAMYKAKESGRGVIKFFEEAINAGLQNHLQMESALRNGIKNGEFTVHYQPKVSLKSGLIVGMESLVRWFPPEGPMVSPVRFIPVAEDSGLILPLGAQVLRDSCRQAAIWRKQGQDIHMAVNLSALQFQKSELVDEVQAILEEEDLPPGALELEITESMVMGNVERSIERMKALKALGLTLAVDDFGTGYSSLNYLKKFPIDTLKIDQSFVRDLGQTREGLAIVLAIISMGQALHLKLVAEGVETREQLDILRELGCHEIQGYYFSKPVAAEGIGAMFADGKRLTWQESE